MRLLLDTHVAVWGFTEHPRMSAEARSLLTDSANDIFVSAVNVLEVGIKHALQRAGPDPMPISSRQFVVHSEAAAFEMLPILAHHAVVAGELPAHHRDPFDRLLVAQALVDDLILLTHDRVVAGYGSMTLLI